MQRLYRLSLHLLPPVLRLKHGAQMEALFMRNLEDARAHGTWHSTAVSIAGILDVLRRSAYEQLRFRPNQMETEVMTMPSTREIMRNHARSFLVAYVLLTVALFVPYAARQVAPRIEAGAQSSAVLEMLLLGLPFISAMTIPMAVLVAVMYEFARFGKNGTIAMAKSTRDGVKRLVMPVATAAIVMTALAFVVTAEIVPRSNARLANIFAGREVELGDRSMTIGALRQAAETVAAHNDRDSDSRVVSYEVEIQKKLALPAACLVLALAGMALAFRLPRAGMPLVFGGCVTMFGVYYVLLMAGETLADQFVVSPFVGIWGANAFVLLLAIAATWMRSGRTSRV